MNNLIKFIAMAIALCITSVSGVNAATTKFNYQGKIIFNGSPANGSFDVDFVLFNATINGTQLNTIVQNIAITNGLLNTELDFGDAPFDGQDVFLEIRILDPNTMITTILSPRIPVNTAPYAIQANFVADNSITTDAIINGSILGLDLDDLTISAAKIANFQISNVKIANQTIGFEKLATNGAIDGDIVQYNGTSGEWESSSVVASNSPWNNNASNINYIAGNVGIGTINPTSLLHLRGSSADALQLYGTSSSPVIHFRRTINSADWVLKQNANGGKFHIQSELADGNEVLTMDNTGKVGIGTISPSGVLDVRNSSGDVLLNVATDGKIDRKAQTRSLIVGYKSFVPASSTYNYSTLNFLGMNGITSNYTGGGPAKFHANVRLPKNAVVTEFEAITGDNTPSGSAVVKFGYQPFASNNGNITLSTLTSANSPFGEIITAAVNTTILADRMYFIDVDLDRITTPGQNVLFAGARITYTIDEL